MSLKYIDENGNEENIAGIGKDGSTVNAIGRLSSGTAIGDIVIDGAVTTFYAPNSPVTKYYTPWANSLTFYVPLGRQALIMCDFCVMIMLWNPQDTHHTTNIVGSGFNVTRDSSDKTKFTVTKTNSGSSTITVVVF